MRVGFTIVFNGYRHLIHNDWADKLADWLDLWVIVEGAAMNTGSTSWCKKIPEKYMGHFDFVGFGGKDKTSHLFLSLLEKYNDITYQGAPKFCPWASKDEMVNYATDIIRSKTDQGPHFLWQLDVDEQWTLEDMQAAEAALIEAGADCGCFHADMFVGKNLLAKGVWGEGNDPEDPLRNAYRRLWRWNGQGFATHEPPVLRGGNGKEILLPQRFKHYAYYYPQDVEFKQDFYGYDGLVDNWNKLQELPETAFPRPLSDLIPGHWGQTNTQIVYCNNIGGC